MQFVNLLTNACVNQHNCHLHDILEKPKQQGPWYGGTELISKEQHKRSGGTALYYDWHD
jgi:hypothetical protein